MLSQAGLPHWDPHVALLVKGGGSGVAPRLGVAQSQPQLQGLGHL